ncbi:MAG: hypothetical protein ACJ8G3_19075 [Burkholderiaceae bacterium]
MATARFFADHVVSQAAGATALRSSAAGPA